MTAARETLMSRGVIGVSMDDIASAASLSRATVYQHFAGMQSLLIGLLAQDWEGRAKVFTQLNPGNPPSADALSRWLTRLIEGTRRARGSFALHRAALIHDEIGSGLHRAHRHRLVELLFRQLRNTVAIEEATSLRVEAAMIVAEIEYVAAAAVTEWQACETDEAVTNMAERMLAFARQS